MSAFFKDRLQQILVAFVLSFLLLMLLSSDVLGLSISLLHVLVLLLLLYRLYLEEKKERRKSIAYDFLEKFVSGLNLQKNVLQSLEEASKTLGNSQPVKSYDECIQLKEKAYVLYGFENAFGDVMAKEEKNEALLSDYFPLLNEIQEQRTWLEKDREKRNRGLLRFAVFYLLSLLMITILFRQSEYLKSLLSFDLYRILFGVLLSLPYPLILFFTTRRLQYENLQA